VCTGVQMFVIGQFWDNNTGNHRLNTTTMDAQKKLIIALVMLLIGASLFLQNWELVDFVSREQHEQEMRELQLQFEQKENQLRSEITKKSISSSSSSSIIKGNENEERLTNIYLNYNETYGFDHWLEYGKRYDHHLKHMKPGPDFIMLEIGVQSGGSTRIWNSYFGKSSRYVGLDINPECKQFESPDENIFIEIGSQLDTQFLKKICSDYGPFDFIVDDGGHITNMMMVSFYALWGCMKDGGVYTIEDTHTIIQRTRNFDGMLYDGKDIFENMGDLARGQMEYYGDKNKNKAASSEIRPFSDHLESMTIYDSLIFLKYQANKQKNTRFSKGKFIPYGIGASAVFEAAPKKPEANKKEK
jgi:hypothetical protein